MKNKTIGVLSSADSRIDILFKADNTMFPIHNAVMIFIFY